MHSLSLASTHMHMGHHIIKWAKLDIRVIMACDKIQLGPFDYVATHMIIHIDGQVKLLNET